MKTTQPTLVIAHLDVRLVNYWAGENKMEYNCLCDKVEAHLNKPSKDADGNDIEVVEYQDSEAAYGYNDRTRRQWYAWFAWYPVRMDDGKCIWCEKVYRQDTWWTEHHWGGSDNYSITEYKRYEIATAAK